MKVETEIVVEGGLKKIVTTKTETITEPELVVEILPEEYDIAEFIDESYENREPTVVTEMTDRIKENIPGLENVDK